MTRSPTPVRAKNPPPLTPEEVQDVLRDAAVHRVARRYDDAVVLYAYLERSNRDALDAPYFLALIDLARGRPADALPRLQPLARRLPEEPRILNALIYALRELGQWSAALDAVDRLETIKPAAQLSDRPVILEVLGRIDEAVAHYRTMAATPASQLDGLIGLAQLRASEISPGDKAAMARAAQTVDVGDDLRARLYFSLGEVEEQRGDFDAAFTAFSAGNRWKRQLLTSADPGLEQPAIGPVIRAMQPDAAAEDHRVATAFRKAVFTTDFIAEYEGRGSHIAAPIFVVGMARSGTTLLEQILSSHRRVQGLGETPTLFEAVRGQYPLDLFAANPPDHFRVMAEAYLKAMHARGWANAPRFVDKMPANYMHVGLIHLMLPNAVILHSVRDPVDTCLACYRKLFHTGHETTYDLGDIGREYVRYREMMDHWAEVLPGRVTEVGHEALVADPDRQIRWLVTEACGLAWDPACLRFYETKRPVRTASVAQVRQPIFTTSIERWRKYEKHLSPLFAALGPYAPAR